MNVPSTPCTIRDLAAACALSTATVSRALAGRVKVRAETRSAVEAAARKLGYKRNAYVAAVMAQMRYARTAAFRGTLAFVHVPSPGQPKLLPTQQRILRGARSRAAELGLALNFLRLGLGGLTARSLGRVLDARGVSGVIFLYADPCSAAAEFSWEKFAAVEIDYGERVPVLNTVCLDHYLTLWGALARLRQEGYRRIGMFLERFKDERINLKWSAPFLASQEAEERAGRASPRIPILSAERITEAEFLAWYAAHRPDIVVGHVDKAVGWLQRAGVRVPATTAFFNLNWTARTVPCAGIDVRPELQGSVAADALLDQFQRNERGLPAEPRTIMFRGGWVNGPTLREPHAAGKSGTV